MTTTSTPGQELRPPLRVFLVDDQELVRAGFRMLIDAQPDLQVVGEAGDGATALEQLAVTRCDVVLMDVRMPRLDGVEGHPPAGRPTPGAAGPRADHLRPRRVCVRRDPRGRGGVPAQGRHARRAARRDPGGACR